MIINEKVYRKKSPEDIAYRATEAHYFLFYFKDLNEVTKRTETQANIDADLEMISVHKSTSEKVKAYVS